ncbi:MAG: GTP-binding protein [Deltaproteobacteria bacterium]|nr:GTP-binding protein [Deltaproteobacteria bacterium]
MKFYESAKLRNVGLFGHGSSGKTSLLEAILFNVGLVNRLGRVEDGNTVSDFEPEEKSKLYSISSSVSYAEWNKHLLNLIDAPGGANFISEAIFALEVVDGALLTVCSGQRRGSADRENVEPRRGKKPAARVFHQQDGPRARRL